MLSRRDHQNHRPVKTRGKVTGSVKMPHGRTMQRRTFVSMAAGATMAAALKPVAIAGAQETKRPTPYPDPAIEVVDHRFAKYQVISAAVERLYTGARWAEGPVWFGDGR